MDLLRCKTRLSVLWVIKAIGLSSYLLLGLMKFDTLEDLLNGMNPVFVGLFWWIPWIMAWLSMTLKGSANRWSNFIVGIIIGILLIIDMARNASRISPAMIIDFIVSILVMVLIVWYAWKLPKEEVKQAS